MELYFDHDMVLVAFDVFHVVECRVVVCRDDGFSFWSVPQHMSYRGHSSFPDCSGTESMSISLICCLPCHGAFFLFCWQDRACGLNGFGVIVDPAARCPGFLHLRQSCSLMRHWNSSLEMLHCGRLLVVSNSIGSPRFWLLLFVGRYVPSGFRGVLSVGDVLGDL